MTPIQIIEEIQNCKTALTQTNIRLKTLGINLAQAESTYRIAVARKEIHLRKVEKYPANLVYDIARGDEAVAKLSLNRDIAQIDYEVCREGLRNIRVELEALRSLLAWDRVELKNT